jgi:hypothetical protein
VRADGDAPVGEGASFVHRCLRVRRMKSMWACSVL